MSKGFEASAEVISWVQKICNRVFTCSDLITINATHDHEQNAEYSLMWAIAAGLWVQLQVDYGLEVTCKELCLILFHLYLTQELSHYLAILVCFCLFVLFHFEFFAFSFQERGKESVGYKVSIYHLNSSTQRSISLIHTQPARIISLSVPK